MSIWGVDQAPPSAVIVTAGGDVVTTAGTETNVLSGTVTVPTPGANFVLASFVSGWVQMGATPPSALVWGVRVGVAADYDTFTFLPAILTANNILPFGFCLAGVFARNALAAGGTINITINSTGQAVTLKVNSRVVHLFHLAPDV